MKLLRLSLAAMLLGSPAGPSAQLAPVPPRDPATAVGQTVGTARLSGTVVVAGTGQPARGARVSVSALELRIARSTVTDAGGRFAFVNLPAGRYSLNASKAGFVTVSYGQTRPGPGRGGTPIQLADGQQFDVRLQMPRGGVITGTILDEQGEAIPGTQVRVLRHAMQSGVRMLQQAGNGATDDRGIYRVYGLQPGDYVVLAVPRTSGGGAQIDQVRAELEALRQQAAALAQQDAARARELVERAAAVEANAAAAEEPVTGYAPVYYPGTTAAASASNVTVGAGEERAGVDFQLQLVPIARIEGIVTNSSEQPLQNIQVVMAPAGQSVPGVPTQSARPDRDGRFSIANVAPGHYTIVARATVGERGGRAALEAGARGTPVGPRGMPPGPARGPAAAAATRLWAMADISVDGRSATNIVLTLQPGMTVSGRFGFQGTTQQTPTDFSRARVSLVPADPGGVRELASSAPGQVDASGRFTIGSVAPGRYRFTASVGPGWSVESAVVDGQDSLDFPIEVKANQSISGAVVTFTDRQAELSGTVTDNRGQPAVEYTIVAFPSDSRFWLPQSRRILSTRPATDGRYTFRNLPPGEYRLAPVVDPEPGAWFDPAFLQQLESSAVRVTVAEGEKKTQDIRLAGLQ